MTSDARIRVTEAIYGELSSKERCITVTDLLNNWLTYYDGLYLRLPPETKNTLPGFKDPAKGRKKQFKITYVINGVERTNLYGEYEEVEIIAEREPSVEPSVALALPLVLKGNEALVNELITRHAPEVRLHREEQYYPCSIEWYLRLCELCYDGKQVIDNDPRVVPTLQGFEQILQSITVAGVKHTAEEPNSDFYVTPTKDNKAVAYAGVRELDSVPIYAHVIQYDDTKEIDIQYYFFYAYNGPIVALLQKAGTHEGDWEHVTMRLAPDGSLRAVFMDTYPKEHKWYMQEASSPRAHDGFVLNKEGHPIVWAAKHSHTSYAWAGLQRRTVGLGIVDEVTDDFGMHWQTWRRVINIGNPERPLNGQLWVRFAGSWGTPARNKLDYGGKRTPSMLHAYRFGDPPPDRTSMLPNDGASHRHCGIPQTTVSRMLVRDAERAVSWSHWRRVEELPPVYVLGCGPVAAATDGTVWARTDADQWQALGTAPPRLRAICMQGGTLWAAGLDGSVASRPAVATAAAWTAHPVQLSWVTCGGSRVYGVSLAGTDVLVRTERQWDPLLPPPPHPLSTLSASADGALFATTSDGRAFFRLAGAAAAWLPASADARFASAAIATDVEGLAVSLGTRKLVRWNGVAFAPTEELFSAVTTGADGTFYALDEDATVAKLCRRSLRLCPVRSFTKICDDRGIDSAPQPITFFRPVPLHGFAVLGDFVEQTQMTQPHWTAAALSVAEETNDASGTPLLADPVGFDCVWMAVGTRAKVPFSLWRPIAPESYAALGYVAVASADAAPRVQVKCVHHSLLAQGLWKPQGAERYLWSDKRLGTKLAPVSLWASEAHGADMVAGTFGTSPTYEEPGDPPLCIRGTL